MTIPLRESFALPFFWLQVAAVVFLFKPSTNTRLRKVTTAFFAFLANV